MLGNLDGISDTTVVGTDSALDGDADGAILGSLDGALDGILDGELESISGVPAGCVVDGEDDGPSLLDTAVGESDGASDLVGTALGASETVTTGALDGCEDGRPEGCEDDRPEGCEDG